MTSLVDTVTAPSKASDGFVPPTTPQASALNAAGVFTVKARFRPPARPQLCPLPLSLSVTVTVPGTPAAETGPTAQPLTGTNKANATVAAAKTLGNFQWECMRLSCCGCWFRME